MFAALCCMIRVIKSAAFGQSNGPKIENKMELKTLDTNLQNNLTNDECILYIGGYSQLMINYVIGSTKITNF